MFYNMIDDHLNINHLAAVTLPLVMTNIHINRKHTAISAVHIINVTSACVLFKLRQKSALALDHTHLLSIYSCCREQQF